METSDLPPSAAQLKEQANDAVAAGQLPAARALLQQAIRQEPHYVPTWLSLAGTDSTVAEQRVHLKRVLEIDPGNSEAQQRFSILTGRAPGDLPTTRLTVEGCGCAIIIPVALTTYWLIVSLPYLMAAPIRASGLGLLLVIGTLAALIAGLWAIFRNRRRWGVYAVVEAIVILFAIVVWEHAPPQPLAFISFGFLTVVIHFAKRWSTLQ